MGLISKHDETVTQAAVDISDELPDTERLWIFGYGSILWQTGFKYNVKRIGYIKGYDRVFWQGNSTHRGTKDKVCDVMASTSTSIERIRLI